MNAPAPKLPNLTFLGDNERIIDASAVHTKMDAWPSGTLRMVENAEHEVFMDNPKTRATLTKEAVAFLPSE
jgi:lysophospholipase